MLDRLNTIIELDTAITRLEVVRGRLIDMACTDTLDRRVEGLLQQLEDLRLDILQADLPGEHVAYIARDRSGKQTEAYTSVDEATDAGVAAEMAGEIDSDWAVEEK